ncbi:hypothetical protein BCV70DRAFT_214646 [Testicularia cyperi]|uniref:TFIIS central domain-containing protein n=1 Tax=Testicularia cyperi TaxID=1882483 RepID=A0A317XYH7_9BASI|nr:hypothetical protein BCV70DRAFT_214646 [Testicularia cyperi]
MTDIRDRSAKFLADSLAASSSEQDASAAASQLEQAIFDEAGQSTSNDYRNEVRSIGLTLKKDNPQLAADLLQGNISATQIAGMSPEDMKSAEQAKKDEALRQENLNASIGVDELDPEQGLTHTGQQGTSRMEEDDMYTYGEAGDGSMGGGGEGEFKARAQPKVGEAMRGIEFETGQ